MRLRRILLMCVCLGILSTANACYIDPYPYAPRPSYRREGHAHFHAHERPYGRRDRGRYEPTEGPRWYR